MACTVRKGEKKDLTAVSALLTSTWYDTYADIYSPEQIADITARWHNRDVLLRQLSDPGIAFHVAEIDDQIVGHALSRKHAGDILWLVRLYVLPGFQGRGAGKDLFAETIKFWQPVTKVRLEVEPENHNALAFYRARGFVQIGETENCGGDSDIAALIMEKAIKDV